MDQLKEKLKHTKLVAETELETIRRARVDVWCDYVEKVLNLLTPQEIHQGSILMKCPFMRKDFREIIMDRFSDFYVGFAEYSNDFEIRWDQ